MDEKDLVEKARLFATKAHSGQIRPNKAGEPYESHLREVAELVAQSGGSEAEIAGAWLHDSVEDTQTTLADVINHFGNEVGLIVEGMTDPPDFSKLQTLDRKTRQAERIVSKTASVKRVKLADQTSNIRSVAVDPPVKWNTQKCLDYIEGARRIAEQCRGVSKFLDREFEAAYKRAMQVYSKEFVASK